MGMHHGYIVAAAPWPALREALESTGPFRPLDGPAEEDEVLVSEVDGVSYLLEGSMILSMDPDFVVQLSRELGCRVVGMGAETISGTTVFVAAESGAARRVHFDITATLTRPYELGDPLPGEEAVSWRDLDGAGLFTALEAFGLPAGPLADLHESRLRFEPAYEQFPSKGPIGDAVNEHVSSFEVPDADSWTKNIKVVVRGEGAFDIVAAPPRKRRWFRRSR